MVVEAENQKLKADNLKYQKMLAEAEAQMWDGPPSKGTSTGTSAAGAPTEKELKAANERAKVAEEKIKTNETKFQKEMETAKHTLAAQQREVEQLKAGRQKMEQEDKKQVAELKK